MSLASIRTLKTGIWLIPTATWLILCAALYPTTGLLQPLLFTPDASHAQKIRSFLEEQNIPYLVKGTYNILVGSKVRERTAGELAQRGLLGFNKGARLFSVLDADPETSLSQAIENSSAKIDRALVALAPNTNALAYYGDAHAYIRLVTHAPLQQREIEELHQLVSTLAPTLAENQITIRSVARQSLAHANELETLDMVSMANLTNDHNVGEPQ
ncbi:MAG: hypothetical protein P9L94_15705 [Candidatus Hinthialibacter antarcticus]|nr:hypothetical protein [Candidatus Hinthialibacter antarcticus]